MEKFFRGIPGSRIVATGKAVVLLKPTLLIPRYRISQNVETIDKEIDKLENALLKTKNELEALKSEIEHQRTTVETEYLDSSILMLDDPTIKQRVSEKIRESYLNIEWVFNEVIEEMAHKLKNSDTHYFRERAPDIVSIGHRVLKNLIGTVEKDAPQVGRQSVVIAHTLSPPEIVYLYKLRIRAIVTEIGGKTSHAAIMAQDLEIPAVIGVENVTTMIQTGDTVIVDGTTGTVIVNPENDTEKLYRLKEREQKNNESTLRKIQNKACELKEGTAVSLLANMDLEEELDLVQQCGCTGVGLFRTEYLFLNRVEAPGEEVQFSIYRKVVEGLKPHPVTIRTIDIGGDKKPPYFEYVEEANPFLGLRGIRFALKHGELLRPQIRAILRAACYGEARMMFPMVNDVDELVAVRQVVDECEEDLKREGIPHHSSIKLGVMVETPSSVILLDKFSGHISFISVGTNDLIQYTLAIDRGNGMVADKFDPLHPAILRLLKQISDLASKNGIEAGICGEMAGDPLCTLLLIGFGYRILSMSTMNIPTVKNIIINSSSDEARIMADHVLNLSSSSEIRAYVSREMIARFKTLEDYFR
jgi:phosphotransferase system enzyme I (PtsI)